MTRQPNPVQPTVAVAIAHHQPTARQLRNDYLAHLCAQSWQRLAAFGRRKRTIGRVGAACSRTSREIVRLQAAPTSDWLM